MACLASLSNINAGCSPKRMGGVRAIILFLRSSTSSAAVSENADYAIATNGAANVGKRLPFKGSFQSVAQQDENTGQTYYRDELAGSILNSVTAEPGVLAQLGSAGPDDLVIGVERWDRSVYIMGYGFKDPAGEEMIATPVFYNGGQIGTGAEKSDSKGMQVTFVSVHPQPAAIADIAATEISNPSTD